MSTNFKYHDITRVTRCNKESIPGILSGRPVIEVNKHNTAVHELNLRDLETLDVNLKLSTEVLFEVFAKVMACFTRNKKVIRNDRVKTSTIFVQIALASL